MLLKDNEIYISLPEGYLVSKRVNLGCEFIDTKIDRRGTNPITELKSIIKTIKIVNKIKPDIAFHTRSNQIFTEELFVECKSALHC